jgi:hypothetical protein
VCGVVAGQVDVGQGQQAREQVVRPVHARHRDEGAAGWQNTHVVSLKANGEMTKSPVRKPATADPTSSTMPINSCPIGVPCSDAGSEW